MNDIFRLIPLASSSKANCTVVVAGGQVIIVDAGISRKSTIGQLSELGILTHEHPAPDALLLTHDHSDHAKYVDDWLKHSQPIYTTCGTWNKLGIDHASQWRPSRPFEPRRLGGATITPIMVPHDAAEPVAWRIAAGGRAAVIATDLGGFPVGWDLFLTGATDLLLETNFHPRLLETCDYPEHLKARIAAADGHMSILTACDWIRDRMPSTLENLWLGHISTKACHPKIVRSLARKALADGGHTRVNLEVLDQ